MGSTQVFNWFRRRKAADGLLAVCPSRRGVSAALVRHSATQPPVLAWAEFEPEGSPAGRRAVVERLVKARDLDGRPCTTLVAPGDYSLILVETPQVPEEELRQAVRWRVKDLIDFGVDDAVIDVFEVPTLKGGRDNMLYAVVARSNAVRDLIANLSGTGLALEYVDIPELAIRNLTALMPEDVGGVAFIHLDDQAGLITITRQGTLYLSRRFDYGRARLLDSGVSEIGPEVEGLLDAIVIEAQRSLDYYESHFAQPPVQGAVLAPLGVEIAGVPEYLSSQLGIPTRYMVLSELIDSEVDIASELVADCLPAIGAALRRAGAEP